MADTRAGWQGGGTDMAEPRPAAGVTIRPARLDDADELGEIHVRAWQWAYRDQLPEQLLAQLDPASRAADWRHMLGPDGDEGFRAWVAEVDGMLVGFAGSCPPRDADMPPATVELDRLYLLEGFVGRGIGAALLRQAESRWSGSGYTSAVAWVLASNERGRAFYVRTGWRPDGAERDLTIAGGRYPELRLTKKLLPLA